MLAPVLGACSFVGNVRTATLESMATTFEVDLELELELELGLDIDEVDADEQWSAPTLFAFAAAATFSNAAPELQMAEPFGFVSHVSCDKVQVET